MGCIMGCKLEKDHKLHCFPRNLRRRAEWCRILGVYPRKKRVCLCSAHIPACYMMKNTISRFTVPNPPESRKFITNFSTNTDTTYNTDKIENKISNLSEDIQFPLEKNIENCQKQTAQETPESKIEDYEIRKGKNNDMIIKGRFIQTHNYLMVSYTPSKKWSLQKQVTLLDKHCTQQLQQIRKINGENCRLRTELKKYERLLPKLRYLQMHNRFFFILRSKCKNLKKMLLESANSKVKKTKTILKQNLPELH